MRILLIALLLPLSSGCSRKIKRYEVSGEVTYGGKAVPAGTISFEPTGKSVMGGFAKIVDGKYDTAQNGVGHLGGEHVIKITGDARAAVNPNSFQADSYVAKPLFPKYEFTTDLPRQRSTKDFQIPSGQASAK